MQTTLKSTSSRTLMMTLLIIIISACSTRPMREAQVLTPAQQAQWQQHEQQIQAIADWQLRGRMAIQHGEEAASSTVFWQQQQHHYQVHLSTSLGRTLAELNGNTNNARLSLDNGRSFFAANGDLLLANQLGWPLKLSQLKHWIRGIPAPDQQATPILDENARAQFIEVDDWIIEYQSYQRVENHWLPKRIRLYHPDIQIKINIYEWQI